MARQSGELALSAAWALLAMVVPALSVLAV